MNPTVFINGRFLSQRVTGVQRFGRELTRALLARGTPVKVLAPRNADLGAFSGSLEIIGVRTGHFWEQYELPRYLRQLGSPLLLNLGNIAPLTYANQIVTLHDLAYLRHPESYRFLFRNVYRWLIPSIVKRARAVVTVSEFSKAEISEAYGIDADDIAVIYNAADDRFSESDVARRADTFLALAADSDQKNHVCILKAFNILAQKRTAHLRIMGLSTRFDKHPLLQLPGASTVTQLGGVTDTQLVDEYRRAGAFIFPPLYAGFGIPPVEAQACGCPVIASAARALEEVLGNSAIYFDPLRPEQLCRAMERLMDESELRCNLGLRGRANVCRFDWTKSAQDMEALITHLSSGAPVAL